MLDSPIVLKGCMTLEIVYMIPDFECLIVSTELVHLILETETF